MTRRTAELQAARYWQIEHAWAELKTIDDGRRGTVGWSEIEMLIDHARRRIQRGEVRPKRRRG